MKAGGLLVSVKIFENCILKTFCVTPWPTKTIWTITVGNHPGTIPVEFGQIPISVSRKEVVWTFPYIIQCKIVTPSGGVNFDPRGIIWIFVVENLYIMLFIYHH